MTQLLDNRETIKVELPSYPEVEVELYTDILTRDQGVIDSQKTDYERGVKLLECLIKTWPFTDKDGNSLPVNAETIGSLPSADSSVLITEVNRVMKLASLE